MAERRMFAKSVIDSDMFLDMPLSTQALYFHLSMRADDDGFVNNPKKVQRMIGASDDDIKVLIAKRFVLPFDSGVVVIRHWKIHNYIAKDRYHESMCEEKTLITTDKNGVYNLSTGCIQDVNNLSTQVRLGKERKGEDSLGEVIDGADAPKRIRHKYGEYQNVLLTDEDYQKLMDEFPDYKERIERLSSYIASTGKTYKNHLATIRNWAKRDKEKNPSQDERTRMLVEWAMEE